MNYQWSIFLLTHYSFTYALATQCSAKQKKLKLKLKSGVSGLWREIWAWCLDTASVAFSHPVAYQKKALIWSQFNDTTDNDGGHAGCYSASCTSVEISDVTCPVSRIPEVCLCIAHLTTNKSTIPDVW